MGHFQTKSECARKAGKEQEVKVRHGEGPANHPDPE
jgi:hypothetical protein